MRLDHDFLTLKNEIAQLLDQCGNLRDQCGELFSSGLSALKKGELYVMGLNPGGGARYKGLGEFIDEWKWPHFSAFEEQCWHPKCWNEACYGPTPCNCGHAPDAIQFSQREVIQATLDVVAPGTALSDVFATNAIFVRSTDWSRLKVENALWLTKGTTAWAECRPMHQLFLEKVCPSVILCFGYARKDSAFSFAQQLLHDVHMQCEMTVPGDTWKIKRVKAAKGTFNLGGIKKSVLAIGVAHPSRYKTVLRGDAVLSTYRKFLSGLLVDG